MVLGTLLTLPLVTMCGSDNAALRGFAKYWVSIAFNIPSLFHSYIVSLGLGSFNIQVSSWVELVAGVNFNNTDYRLISPI